MMPHRGAPRLVACAGREAPPQTCYSSNSHWHSASHAQQRKKKKKKEKRTLPDCLRQLAVPRSPRARTHTAQPAHTRLNSPHTHALSTRKYSTHAQSLSLHTHTHRTRTHTAHAHTPHTHTHRTRTHTAHAHTPHTHPGTCPRVSQHLFTGKCNRQPLSEHPPQDSSAHTPHHTHHVISASSRRPALALATLAHTHA